MCSKKVRKQLYLTEEQNEELKALAVMQNTSEASIVREAVAEYLERAKKMTKRDPLDELIGLGKGKHTDNAERHDDYLYGEEDK